jgi:hypothetical protein
VAERWIIDADGAAPLVLPLVRQLGAVHVTAHETPPPAPRTVFAPRPEGALPVEREHELRDVSITVAVAPVRDPFAGSTHDFAPGGAPEAEGDGSPPGWAGTVRRASGGREELAAIEDLQQVLGALRTSPHAIAGTLTRVLDDGRRATLDVVEVLDDGMRWDLGWYAGRWTEIKMTLRCLPYWRSDEILIGTASRVAGQRLNIVTGQVPGDVDALARIELTGATWTQRSALYALGKLDDDPLEVPCTTLIRPPGSTLTTMAESVNAQVALSAAVTGALPVGLWDRVASLETAAGPLPRTGRFRVILRLNTNEVEPANAQVRMRWSAGPREAGLTTNPPATVLTSGWVLLDLGIVSCSGVLSGVIETSLPRPNVRLDELIFVPIDGKSGVVSGTTGFPPTTLVAADLPSSVTSGALVGSPAPPSGTAWTALASHATAFTRTSTGVTLAPTTGTWRAAGVPTGTWTTLSASVRAPTNTHDAGAAFSDLNAALVVGNAGGATAMGTVGIGPPGSWCIAVGFRGPGVDIVNSLYGGLFVWFIQDGVSRQLLLGESRLMSNGGEATLGLTLSASGEIALDCEFRNPAGVVLDRSTTVLQHWSPPPPSGLSVGIASAGRKVGGVAAGVTLSGFTSQTSGIELDSVLSFERSARIDSAGASRVAPSGVRGPLIPEGDLPRLPASGRTGTDARVAVLTTRGLLRDQFDLASDPLTIAVHATPQWLQIPGDPT